MKKIIYTTIAIVCLSCTFLSAGNGLKRFKGDEKADHLGSGFTLTAIGGMNYALTGKGYNVATYNSNYASVNAINVKYDLKSAIGFRFGLGIGFQGKGYGLEIPLVYNVDRYKVPSLSDKERMRFSGFEFGIINYIKPGGGNHNIIIGPYAVLDFYGANINDFGVAIGYGYSFNKRINLSLRYKMNIIGMSDKYSIYVKVNEAQQISQRYQSTSGLQLVARFDMVNTRKIKKYVPPPLPPRIPLNYTSYSDVELIKLMKEAKAKNDIDTYGDIQREADLRKSRNPYGKYDDTQLTEMLGKAVKSENFLEAEKIQKEQKRRLEINAAEAQ